jgi:hypothetical protein
MANKATIAVKREQTRLRGEILTHKAKLEDIKDMIKSKQVKLNDLRKA